MLEFLKQNIFTEEEVKEFLSNLHTSHQNIKEETPSSEERIAALEKAIADLALLFTINN